MMRASNESRENDLAACKTLEASSKLLQLLTWPPQGIHCQTQPYDRYQSCRLIRRQAASDFTVQSV